MKIAFNGQRLAGQRFGVGRYIEYLLRHWANELTADEELTVFVRRPVEAELDQLSSRIKFVLLESNRSGLIWENLRLGPAAACHDVLFCPAYTAPINYGGKLVVATHSVNETQPGAHTWLYKQTYARLHKHCAQIASAVIVPGLATRSSVIQHYGVEPERVVVVNQGADDVFQPVKDVQVLRAARERFFGVDRPYILFVGKCSERRNIPMLIRAYAALRAEKRIPHGLVLFGPAQDINALRALCVELGVGDDVVQTDGKVAHHHELVPIYAGADVFVHPSENEGWSMTTVEAMACGVAVIAADRGGLGEVARGHALMVTAPSVASLAEAIGNVLHDPDLRLRLQVSGRARGASLRWSEIARQTLDVVRASAGQPGRVRMSGREQPNESLSRL